MPTEQKPYLQNASISLNVCSSLGRLSRIAVFRLCGSQILYPSHCESSLNPQEMQRAYAIPVNTLQEAKTESFKNGFINFLKNNSNICTACPLNLKSKKDYVFLSSEGNSIFLKFYQIASPSRV